VVTIIVASKVVPQFREAGSLPMIGAVIMAPGAIKYVQDRLGLHGIEGVQGWILAGGVSITLFAGFVHMCFTFGIVKPASEAAKELLGKQAASVMKLEYLQGTPVDVARPGSVKVVEFWATWCPPCKTAIPHLNKLWKKLVKEHGDNKIQFVGVTTEGKEKVENFIETMGDDMKYPVALDTSSSLKPSYPTAGIPHAFLVGKDGKICWSGHPGGGDLENAINAALAATPPAVQAAPAKKPEEPAKKPEEPKKKPRPPAEDID